MFSYAGIARHTSGDRSRCLKHHIDTLEDTLYPGLLLSPHASCACEDCKPRSPSLDSDVGDPILSSPQRYSKPQLEVSELLDELENVAWRVKALPVPRPPSLSLSDWYGALGDPGDRSSMQLSMEIEAILETSQDYLLPYDRDAASVPLDLSPRMRSQTCLTGSQDSGYGSGPSSPAIILDYAVDLDATPRRHSDPSSRRLPCSFDDIFPDESQLSLSSSMDNLASPAKPLARVEPRIPAPLQLPPLSSASEQQDEPPSATRRTFRRMWSRLTLKDASVDPSNSSASPRSSGELSPAIASFLNIRNPQTPARHKSDHLLRSRKSRSNLSEAEPESFLIF